MPRRKAKPTGRPANPWALIAIDSRPIRDKARKDYDKVLRDLEKARQELERFERHDKPGFEQWMNRRFGALITELRETSQNLQAKRELLFEIETEAVLSHSSFTRAYEQVMWRKAHPQAPEDGSPNEPGAAEEDDPFRSFEEFFSSGPEQNFQGEFHGAHHSAGPAPRARKEVGARIKELYRAIVRRLHPDTQGAMTSQRAEWWHQAQAAYQEGDADRLQVLLTLCEIEEQGTTVKTSVSLLKRITQEFKSALRSLKKQLRQHQADPAWDFSRQDNRQSLASKIEGTLRQDLAIMKRTLDVINGQLELWARQAQSTRRAPLRRRSPFHHPEFWF